jgi:hypothetical protein
MIAAHEIIPEMSLTSPTTGAVGSLDFYVNGQLGWGIELLIEGNGIKQHKARFTSGPYTDECIKDYRIVDFRMNDGPQRDKIDPKDVVVIFSEDFESATLKFGQLSIECHADR